MLEPPPIVLNVRRRSCVKTVVSRRAVLETPPIVLDVRRRRRVKTVESLGAVLEIPPIVLDVRRRRRVVDVKRKRDTPRIMLCVLFVGRKQQNVVAVVRPTVMDSKQEHGVQNVTGHRNVLAAVTGVTV